ncbi:MAG TPA: glycosyltransferase family 2 protein [Stellaceae bacterium]|jgi:glycosyltransferase involved in cell wall biosynthesis|nr:glycosyltransferase family 2 protein [Stellaceae bacterium]
MIEFSVITVAKNAAATLEKCIASVEMQRHPALEYILVDGASTDETATIVARHKSRVDRFVSEADSGIYDAMNKGLALARGRFIYFLGADDYLLDENVLSDVAGFLERTSGCDFIYGGIEVRHSDGRADIFMPPPPEEALRFLVSGCLPHQASFASRRAFDLAGAFDDRYRIAGDYDWFLRVVGHPQLVTRRIERVIASYRSDGVSNRLERSQPEVFAIQNAMPLFRQPEWLQRRIAIFLRDSLSYSRRAVTLSQHAPASVRLGRLTGLLVQMLTYPVERLLAALRPPSLRPKVLERLQARVLRQRIANDALAHRADATPYPLQPRPARD